MRSGILAQTTWHGPGATGVPILMSVDPLRLQMIGPNHPLAGDLPLIVPFRFESTYFYEVDARETGGGFTWSIIRRPASPPIVRESRWMPFEPHVVKPRGYAALLGDSPVGYMEFNYEEWCRLVRIWHFYVRPDVRRKGVGRQMMNEIFGAAKHFRARGVRLETQTANVPAIDFYRRMGFEMWGISTHYYSNQDIANRDVYIEMGIRLT
jgi:ribosomal protein S18 acetylase RimI-like enzyme